MPILVRKDESVLFVHIPKCGGSSFVKAMIKRGWRELFSIRGIHANLLKFMRCSPQHLHAEHLNQLVRPEAFDHIITLVRDPLARLRSEYCWQTIQDMTNLSPESWIRHVFSEYGKDPFVYDNHIRPQHEFLLGENKFLKLEEDGVHQALKSVSSDGKEMDCASSATEASSGIEKVKVTKKTAEILESFTSAKDQIADFYRKDYELLGYPTP